MTHKFNIKFRHQFGWLADFKYAINHVQWMMVNEYYNLVSNCVKITTLIFKPEIFFPSAIINS